MNSTYKLHGAVRRQTGANWASNEGGNYTPASLYVDIFVKTEREVHSTYAMLTGYLIQHMRGKARERVSGMVGATDGASEQVSESLSKWAGLWVSEYVS